MIKEVCKRIEDLQGEYLNIWKEFCDIESLSADKEGVDKATDYIVDIAKKLGFETEYSYQKVSGNVVCITLNPQAKGTPVCFSGHVDTVHEKGLFGYPPTKIYSFNIF